MVGAWPPTGYPGSLARRSSFDAAHLQESVGLLNTSSIGLIDRSVEHSRRANARSSLGRAYLWMKTYLLASVHLLSTAT